jgi:hypothetical protein
MSSIMSSLTTVVSTQFCLSAWSSETVAVLPYYHHAPGCPGAQSPRTTARLFTNFVLSTVIPIPHLTLLPTPAPPFKLLPSTSALTTHSNTNEMATSASTTVFADFDLLEDILLHLPLQDLLLTERVCKQWQGMQQTSSRVRKALFLEPFHAQKIYYPTASKPWWYLVPGHAELQQQGFLGEDDPDNNQVSYPATSTQLETVPGSGSSEGSDSSGGSDVTVCNLIQDKHYLRPSSSSSKKKKDVLGSSHLYEHDTVNPNPVIPKGPPADKKMLVSRIASGPFFNPFAEKFRK